MPDLPIPAPDPPDQVTLLLRAAQSGDPDAAARLLSIVYGELRALARARMGHATPGQTLQPTALVHEAYLRLAGKGVTWEGRRHFFFAAGRAMRDILVEQARRKAGPRHGGDRRRSDADPEELAVEPPDVDVLALHEVLGQLEREDPDKARVVELRYFTGLTMEETAEVLGRSPRTLHREWRFIKAWLRSRLGRPGGPDEPE